VNFSTACKRAGGRRRVNAVAKPKADLRRQKLVGLIKASGLGRGMCRQYVRLLGVHTTTVSKDLKKLRLEVIRILESKVRRLARSGR
jgi:hypothetical protein